MEENRKNKNRHIVFWTVIAVNIAVLALLQVAIQKADVADKIHAQIAALFYIVPVTLGTVNLSLLFIKPAEDVTWKLRIAEIISAILGLFSFLVVCIGNVSLRDWGELSHSSYYMHIPVAKNAIMTFIVLCAAGFICYLFLAFTNAKKVSPILTTAASSGVALGLYECVMLSIQLISIRHIGIYLAFFTLNCAVIAIRIIIKKVYEMKSYDSSRFKNETLIGRINIELSGKRFFLWTIAGAVILLGLIIGILTFFGQHPLAFVKGYIDTADWTFSRYTREIRRI